MSTETRTLGKSGRAARLPREIQGDIGGIGNGLELRRAIGENRDLRIGRCAATIQKIHRVKCFRRQPGVLPCIDR